MIQTVYEVIIFLQSKNYIFIYNTSITACLLGHSCIYSMNVCNNPANSPLLVLSWYCRGIKSTRFFISDKILTSKCQ